MFTIIRIRLMIVIFGISIPFSLLAVPNRAFCADASTPAQYATLYENAVVNDDADSVKTLIEQGMSPNQNDTNGDPLLYRATHEKATKIMQLLITKGADVNAPSPDNDLSPLMQAVAISCKPAVDILIAAKPNLAQEDDDGDTALNIAQLYDENMQSTTTSVILKTLKDVKAPIGDQLQSLHSKDREIVAHVTSFKVDPNSGIATITGIVANLGKQHYAFAEIDAKFTGSFDLLVDTAMDNVQSLDAHENWKFSISTLKSGVTGYHLTSLTAHP